MDPSGSQALEAMEEQPPLEAMEAREEEATMTATASLGTQGSARTTPHRWNSRCKARRTEFAPARAVMSWWEVVLFRLLATVAVA